VFVSIKGSPHARFKRALATRNPTLVLAAAAELPRVSLEDALAICLILRDGASPRYERAAVRLHGRLCLELPGLSLEDADLVLTALRLLPSPHGRAGVAALSALLESRGDEPLANVLAAWLAHAEGHS
jgi:hypothetical protein